MKLLIEDRILEDVLRNRESQVNGSSALLSVVEAGYASGFVIPQTITEIYDQLRSHMSRSKAHGVMVDILSLVSVVEMTDEVIKEALALGWSDFRQALIGAAAIHGDISHLIVRNPNDYRSLKMPVLTPEEFVAQSESENFELNVG